MDSATEGSGFFDKEKGDYDDDEEELTDMEVATPPPPPPQHPILISKTVSDKPNFANSMSQGFHQGIFTFSNGFERSAPQPPPSQDHQHHHSQSQHSAQQNRRDKLRVQEFEPPPPPQLVAIEEEESGELPAVYETGGMLSEMFNFPIGTAAEGAVNILENQIPSNYRLQRPPPPAAVANEWYGNRHHHHHQISSIHADSAAAMQLFLMNPRPRSPSPPPPLQGFQTAGLVDASGEPVFGNSAIPPAQLTWVSGSSTGHEDNSRSKMGGGIMESQGLSLSLSSSLQHLEAAKVEELRMGDGGGIFFCNQGGGGASSSVSSYPLKNLGMSHDHQNHLQVHNVGFGSSSSYGVVNVLRNSKYAKAAQNLLEEFCSVGRGQLKNYRLGRQNTNPSSKPSGGGGGGTSSSSSKDLSPLSAADRIEYQRRKVKLLSMLDEVDRRHNNYCEQMQMVVNSFDSVMGFGAATPYTALAQKAMSRHFRCLKDAIVGQLKQTCELLGEKEVPGASGVTKGETPRLRFLEQSLRQQRVYHHMGIMEQEAWRPQRGLPERSVNILRAWLFEHFLHPYPSDADKHLLSRQTGLSRNQVANWFINARVRLWKPMVEEMYQQEAKEEAEERESERNTEQGQTSSASAQTPTLTTTPGRAAGAAAATTGSPTTITTAAAAGKRSQINAVDNDPTLGAINTQCFSENQANLTNSSTIIPTTTAAAAAQDDVMSPVSRRLPTTTDKYDLYYRDDTCRYIETEYGATSAANANLESTLVTFGNSTGDVSLTLGLRHAGNLPEKSRFSVGDFGGY